MATRPREAVVPRIAAIVVDEVLRGRLPRGTKISTARIAEDVGASRIPVREALRELAALGVVEYHPNRGFRVPAAPRADDLLALLDVRALLEPEAHGRAAVAASAEERMAVVAAFERADERHRAGATGAAARLHHAGNLAILDAAHHDELHRALAPAMIRSALLFSALRSPERHEGLAGHLRSARAISAGRADEARLLASEHLGFLREAVAAATIDVSPRARRRPRLIDPSH